MARHSGGPGRSGKNATHANVRSVQRWLQFCDWRCVGCMRVPLTQIIENGPIWGHSQRGNHVVTLGDSGIMRAAAVQCIKCNMAVVIERLISYQRVRNTELGRFSK